MGAQRLSQTWLRGEANISGGWWLNYCLVQHSRFPDYPTEPSEAVGAAGLFRRSRVFAWPLLSAVALPESTSTAQSSTAPQTPSLFAAGAATIGRPGLSTAGATATTHAPRAVPPAARRVLVVKPDRCMIYGPQLDTHSVIE